MADTLRNAPTPQQVNDAQLLDDLTSLQQLITTEQSSIAHELSYPALNTPIQHSEQYLDLVNFEPVVWTRMADEPQSKARFQVLWVLKTPC